MKNNKFIFTAIALISFFVYLTFWLLLKVPGLLPEGLTDIYTDTYGILAALGAFIGYRVSKNWGSTKSFVGKSLVFFALGLFFQFLGQLSYTIQFYIYHVENAYPSFGEIFYLASIPAYIAGIWYIAKSSGFTISLKSYAHRLWTLGIPLVFIGISYFFFLKDYDATDLTPLMVFLDFLYPIGQALFVSFALITFQTTRTLLGGVMRSRVLFILFSLVFQYIADSLFIYETRQGTWTPAGNSDIMFVTSYFLMMCAFVTFSNVEQLLSKKLGK